MNAAKPARRFIANRQAAMLSSCSGTDGTGVNVNLACTVHHRLHLDAAEVVAAQNTSMDREEEGASTERRTRSGRERQQFLSQHHRVGSRGRPHARRGHPLAGMGNDLAGIFLGA